MVAKGKGEKANILKKEKRGFYIHLLIYIVVNIALIIQWYWILKGDGIAWVISTAIPWGIGLFAHFLVTFYFGSK